MGLILPLELGIDTRELKVGDVIEAFDVFNGYMGEQYTSTVKVVVGKTPNKTILLHEDGHVENTIHHLVSSWTASGWQVRR